MGRQTGEHHHPTRKPFRSKMRGSEINDIATDVIPDTLI
jgi:hypothetical protein